jgi:hypothetical protein
MHDAGEVKLRIRRLRLAVGLVEGQYWTLIFAFCHLSLSTASTRTEQCLGYTLVGS